MEILTNDPDRALSPTVMALLGALPDGNIQLKSHGFHHVPHEVAVFY